MLGKTVPPPIHRERASERAKNINSKSLAKQATVASGLLTRKQFALEWLIPFGWPAVLVTRLLYYRALQTAVQQVPCLGVPCTNGRRPLMGLPVALARLWPRLPLGLALLSSFAFTAA